MCRFDCDWSEKRLMCKLYTAFSSRRVEDLKIDAVEYIPRIEREKRICTSNGSALYVQRDVHHYFDSSAYKHCE